MNPRPVVRQAQDSQMLRKDLFIDMGNAIDLK